MISPPLLKPVPPGDGNPDFAFLENRPVIFIDGSKQVPLYQGELLTHGTSISGPAIIVRRDTTVFLSDMDTTSVDQFGNLIITISE